MNKENLNLEKDDQNLTPMMQHWVKIKSKYKDFIIFYRLGDFYEMFEEDAREASKILNLALTKRAGHPMCGVPYHSYKIYLKKLISYGKKVVICEQLEDPAKAKGMVKRGVVEVVTPGTIVEEDYLSGENNYIASIYRLNKLIGVSWCDVSTGEFFAWELGSKSAEDKNDKFSNGSDKDKNEKNSDFKENEKHKIESSKVEKSENKKNNIKFDELESLLEKIKPAEILICQDDRELFDSCKKFFTTGLVSGYYNILTAKNLLSSYFNVLDISRIGLKSEVLQGSLNALVMYIQENEISVKPKLRNVNLLKDSNFLEIDHRTFHNLEIFEPYLSTDANMTLFSVLNQTKTSMGKRLLKKWMSFPSRNKEELQFRYNMVARIASQKLNRTISEQLEKIYDIERLMSRIFARKANPMDLIQLKYSIIYARSLQILLEDSDLSFFSVPDNLMKVTQIIEDAILENSGTDFEQNIIKEGFSSSLDEIRSFSKDANKILVEYQENLKKETQISNLKIRYNKVFGYFIEVSKSNLSKVPEKFLRKQTLVNAERFTTEELIELETRILSATNDFKEKQREIFENLVDSVADLFEEVSILAENIAIIDCLSNFAYFAERYNWIKPAITEEFKIVIEDGKHPVLDILLGKDCIPNDLLIDQTNFFHIITGPNMSGKSTYLRQSALILYLAHIGCFVPASRCEFFILDQLFSRIGAQDNIASGQSTFLVEMEETARILNTANPRSFIIFDEVGRGTATFDGMSLAYAICEFCVNEVKAPVLFATHYHE
ncbi:MAG TPA: DNA mismatch repair protein MutS, partial [Exilispira sp.]|nr:DNA mismatch repair protein MutS [Exilispira sp.]